MSEQVNASSRDIYVYITINAEEVIKKYPKNNNKENPEFIEHKYGYMVAGNAIEASGQGTGDLVFTAKIRDRVNFSGCSTSNNFDEVALVTKISHLSGEQVVRDLKMSAYSDFKVPNVNEGIDKQNFYFYNGDIFKAGKENYNVHFTLYTRDESNNPVLYGYFAWDPQIIVNG